MLVPSFRPSDAILELMLLADALRRHGVSSLTCVLQYVPYSRSNRLNRPGLPLGSKVVISMLENSPIDRFVVFDLHARETLGYFNKPVTWMPTLQLMSDAIPINEPEVVVSPDRGRYDDCSQLSVMRSCTLDRPRKAPMRSRAVAYASGEPSSATSPLTTTTSIAGAVVRSDSIWRNDVISARFVEVAVFEMGEV